MLDRIATIAGALAAALGLASKPPPPDAIALDTIADIMLGDDPAGDVLGLDLADIEEGP